MKHDIITPVQSEIASLKRIKPEAHDRKSPTAYSTSLKQACACEQRALKNYNACFQLKTTYFLKIQIYKKCMNIRL